MRGQVFNDGALSQIAQAQEIPYNRKPCTQLGQLNLKGVAKARDAAYLRIADNDAIVQSVRSANETSAKGVPAMVDVQIDYAKRTAFTEGAVKTNFRRFTLGQKARVLARAVTRRITG